MIREDRQITVSEVTAHLDISCGFAYAILRDDMGYRRVCAQWVPKELTAVHKRQRMEVVTQFVRRYEEGPSILERIVTGDETRVHHYDPESKKTKHGMEASLLSIAEEIQKTAFRQENHVDALLGHACTYSCAFPSAWANSEQC